MSAGNRRRQRLGYKALSVHLASEPLHALLADQPHGAMWTSARWLAERTGAICAVSRGLKLFKLN